MSAPNVTNQKKVPLLEMLASSILGGYRIRYIKMLIAQMKSEYGETALNAFFDIGNEKEVRKTDFINLAFEMGRPDVVASLLAAGATVKIFEGMETLEHKAIKKGDVQMLRILTQPKDENAPQRMFYKHQGEEKFMCEESRPYNCYQKDLKFLIENQKNGKLVKEMGAVLIFNHSATSGQRKLSEALKEDGLEATIELAERKFGNPVTNFLGLNSVANFLSRAQRESEGLIKRSPIAPAHQKKTSDPLDETSLQLGDFAKDPIYQEGDPEEEEEGLYSDTQDRLSIASPIYHSPQKGINPTKHQALKAPELRSQST
jgi:hypothetical protein